jgi:hypothetical protein
MPLTLRISRVGPGFCPAAGLPAGAFCDEFAVIQRQKCQLRSERKLGRKAEALPHRPFRHKVSGIGLTTGAQVTNLPYTGRIEK